MRRVFGSCVLATAALFAACEEEPTTITTADVDLRDYLIAPVPGGDGSIVFSVDSTLFDPAVGGTAVRTSNQTWTLRTEESSEDERLFLVEKRAGNQSLGRQFWRWDLVNEGRGIVNEIDGVSYLSLVAPFVVGAEWDPLLLTDRDLVVAIEAEPVSIHKDWGARIDSVGMYSRMNETPVSAVWVTHADSENRIELRQVREVYGLNVGLLERSVDILDSQNLEEVPWDEKAETGFRLRMTRQF